MMRAGSSRRVAHNSAGIDLDAASRAAADFLAALGIDVDGQDLRETPARMARGIPFRTVCEHDLLPFSGVAHVGYLPGERIVGLSKRTRLVEHFAARPRVQARLTRQIAECLATRLRARGVGVVLEAEHSCKSLRGVRAHGAKTVTSALLGSLRADPRSRAAFFALADVPHSSTSGPRTAGREGARHVRSTG